MEALYQLSYRPDNKGKTLPYDTNSTPFVKYTNVNQLRGTGKNRIIHHLSTGRHGSNKRKKVYNRHMTASSPLSVKSITRHLHLLFLVAFFLAWPLTIRLELASFPLPDGLITEYTILSLYFSDILFLLFFILASIRYRTLLKNIICSTWNNLINWKFHVEQKNRFIALPSLLFLTSLISLLLSQEKAISAFQSLRLLEMVLVFYMLVIVLRETNINCSTWNNKIVLVSTISIVGIIQSFFSIIQFFKQSPINIPFIPETQFGPEVPGIAKIIFNGEILVRAYGTLPHPNIIGGLLTLSLISTFYIYKMFPVEQLKIVPRGTFIFLLRAFIAVQSIALFLTFSKSAILALVLWIFIMFYHSFRSVPRGTKENEKASNKVYLFHVKHIVYYVFIGIIIAAALFFLHFVNTERLFLQTLQERSLYNTFAFEMIGQKPIFGWGIGQFVSTIPQVFHVELEPWQYQPVHNIFLLVWSELGIVGLFLILVFLWKTTGLINVSRGTITNGTERCFTILLASWVIIMLFDHYFWDLQQGQILFWTTLALAVVEHLDVERSGGESAKTT